MGSPKGKQEHNGNAAGDSGMERDDKELPSQPLYTLFC